jgi:hypothetical protein
MATNDVPGANPVNNDELHVGCWAEHEDGSLIFIDGAEGGTVVFSMFDMSSDPLFEYRDSMARVTFEKTFSWDPSDPYYKTKTGAKAKQEKWTWHDKTSFPWDKVIKAGAKSGPKIAHASHVKTAAQRMAENLAMRGREVRGRYDHLSDSVVARTRTVFDRFKRAFDELRK